MYPFVGGDINGRRLELPEPLQEVTITKRADFRFRDHEEENFIHIEKQKYTRRESITSDGRTVAFYAEESLTDFDAMIMLVSNYMAESISC